MPEAILRKGIFVDPNIMTTDNAMPQAIVGARNSYMLINSYDDDKYAMYETISEREFGIETN